MPSRAGDEAGEEGAGGPLGRTAGEDGACGPGAKCVERLTAGSFRPLSERPVCSSSA